MSIFCENLSFAYSAFQHRNAFSLKDVNFELNERETICIYGGTGSGKTTLFKLLFGELTTNKGKMGLNNTPLSKFPQLSEHVSFLFQEPVKQFIFPSVKDEYTSIIEQYHDYAIRQNINEICNLFNVNIQDFFNRDIYHLSLGEMRLLQIVFSFSTNTEYLIADEPLEHLEKSYRDIFFAYIKKINDRGILILTKYPELYESITDRSIPITANYA